jgi:hypothetical protein
VDQVRGSSVSGSDNFGYGSTMHVEGLYQNEYTIKNEEEAGYLGDGDGEDGIGWEVYQHTKSGCMTVHKYENDTRLT